MSMYRAAYDAQVLPQYACFPSHVNPVSDACGLQKAQATHNLLRPIRTHHKQRGMLTSCARAYIKLSTVVVELLQATTINNVIDLPYTWVTAGLGFISGTSSSSHHIYFSMSVGTGFVRRRGAWTAVDAGPTLTPCSSQVRACPILLNDSTA